MKPDFIEWTGIALIVLILVILCIAGCNEVATKKPYTLDEHIPKDSNEALAMVIYRNALFGGDYDKQVLENNFVLAKQKAAATLAAEKSFALLSVICAIGMVASIFCIVLGVKTWGFAGLIACGAGLGLAWAGIKYSGVLGIGGLVIAAVGAAYACYAIITELIQHKTALMEVVAGIEAAKAGDTVASQLGTISIVTTVKDIIKSTQSFVQSPTTTKLVDTIREKL